MQAKVSFTQKVKEEICSLSFSDEHLRAILASFIRINGSLLLNNKKEGIALKTENAKIASVRSDEYGRMLGLAEVSLPDGSYEGTVVTEQKHAIDFLIKAGASDVGS